MTVVPQFESFAAVGQAPRERPKDIRGARGRNQIRGRKGHHEKAATRHDRSLGKFIDDPIGEIPIGNIHIHRHLVVELHPFELGLVGLGMEHDLVEHHGAVGAN